MVIDIGNGVDESVVMWKYNNKDKWRDADIDELIHLYDSVVHCKDCRFYSDFKNGKGVCMHNKLLIEETDNDFCSHAERREP